MPHEWQGSGDRVNLRPTQPLIDEHKTVLQCEALLEVHRLGVKSLDVSVKDLVNELLSHFTAADVVHRTNVDRNQLVNRVIDISSILAQHRDHELAKLTVEPLLLGYHVLRRAPAYLFDVTEFLLRLDTRRWSHHRLLILAPLDHLRARVGRLED